MAQLSRIAAWPELQLAMGMSERAGWKQKGRSRCVDEEGDGLGSEEGAGRQRGGELAAAASWTRMSIEKTRRERMGVMGGGRRVGNGTSWLRCLQVKGQMLVVLGGADAPCYGLVVTVLHEDFSWDSLRRVRGGRGMAAKTAQRIVAACLLCKRVSPAKPTYLLVPRPRPRPRP
jgi:hypothetical protein